MSHHLNRHLLASFKNALLPPVFWKCSFDDWKFVLKKFCFYDWPWPNFKARSRTALTLVKRMCWKIWLNSVSGNQASLKSMSTDQVNKHSSASPDGDGSILMQHGPQSALEKQDMKTNIMSQLFFF